MLLPVSDSDSILSAALSEEDSDQLLSKLIVRSSNIPERPR